MRVLVDALSVHFGGGLTFASEQLCALRRVRPDIDLHVLVAPWNREVLASALEREDASTEIVELGSVPARWLWQEHQIPRRAADFDLFYAPGNILPLRPLTVPTVLCQQNPNYVLDARDLPHNQPIGRRIRIAQAHRSMRRATRVVTVAHWLLAALAVEIPVLRERGVAIHSGVPVWTEPSARLEAVGDGPFFVVLSNDAAHKDLNVMVRGWGQAATERDTLPALVIAGHVLPDRVEEHRALLPESVRSRLRHLGPVKRRGEVRWLLEHAEAMVSAARLEALTLTVLEARSEGCPLVLAETPSHVEEAAEVARFFPTGDANALADALLDPPLRPQPPLVWPSWEDHAARLGEVFDEAVAIGPLS